MRIIELKGGNASMRRSRRHVATWLAFCLSVTVLDSNQGTGLLSVTIRQFTTNMCALPPEPRGCVPRPS